MFHLRAKRQIYPLIYIYNKNYNLEFFYVFKFELFIKKKKILFNFFFIFEIRKCLLKLF